MDPADDLTRGLDSLKISDKTSSVARNRPIKQLNFHSLNRRNVRPSSASTTIKPPSNEEFLQPVRVTDKSWGRRNNYDVRKLQNGSINANVESSNFARYANSQPRQQADMTGSGFLDDPNRFKSQKDVADQFLKILDSDSQNESPIDPKDTHIKGLKVPLLDHQVRSLKFFLERERTIKDTLIRGGLLCDDMGLGKTVQMLSLIVSNRPRHLDTLTDIQQSLNADKDAGLHDERFMKHVNLACVRTHKLKTTLIVCPASLIGQWASEVSTKTNLRCYAYHGANRIRDINKLGDYDVIITSYETCMAESRSYNAPLYQGFWWRIILDEAHRIKNTDTLTHKACLDLKSLRRWCLTGTPIQNDVIEMWSLFHFLRVNKYWERSAWSAEIGNRINTKYDIVDGLKKLHKVLAKCMIRRNKSVLKNEFKLPPKHHHVIQMDQETFERGIYEKLEERIIDQLLSTEILDKDLNVGRLQLKAPLMNIDKNTERNTYMVVLVYLLRLRQACCHWQLLFKFKGESDNQVQDQIQQTPTGSELDSLSSLMGGLQIEEVSTPDKPDIDKHSIKVQWLLRILKKDPKRKTIVFSEFTSMLSLLEDVLYSEGFHCLRYDGSLNTVQKQEVLDELRDKPKYTVLLCSLKCGSLGLNLTFCTQVILYEPFWNPAIGAQAVDRVYRIGQTKEVDVYEFFVNRTVEIRIKELQQRKRDIAKAVTDKDQNAIRAVVGGKLTKAELFELLGVDANDM